MEITYKNETEQATKKLDIKGNTVAQFLERIKINPETVLVVRNNTVITENTKLNDKDHLEVLSVVSGG